MDDAMGFDWLTDQGIDPTMLRLNHVMTSMDKRSSQYERLGHSSQAQPLDRIRPNEQYLPSVGGSLPLNVSPTAHTGSDLGMHMDFGMPMGLNEDPFAQDAFPFNGAIGMANARPNFPEKEGYGDTFHPLPSNNSAPISPLMSWINQTAPVNDYEVFGGFQPMMAQNFLPNASNWHQQDSKNGTSFSTTNDFTSCPETLGTSQGPSPQRTSKMPASKAKIPRLNARAARPLHKRSPSLKAFSMTKKTRISVEDTGSTGSSIKYLTSNTLQDLDLEDAIELLKKKFQRSPFCSLSQLKADDLLNQLEQIVIEEKKYQPLQSDTTSSTQDSQSTSGLVGLEYATDDTSVVSSTPRPVTTIGYEELDHTESKQCKVHICDSGCKSKPLFHSTYPGCFSSTHSAADWRRHEETTKHWPQQAFMCVYCPVPPTATDLNPKCQFCHTPFTAIVGAPTAHYLRCPPAQIRGKTFRRKDKLLAHIRNNHPHILNLNQATAAGEFQDSTTNWPRNCGFCQHVFTSWNERMEHIAQHFQNGAKIADWKLPLPVPKDSRPSGTSSHRRDDDDNDDDKGPQGGGGPSQTKFTCKKNATAAASSSQRGQQSSGSRSNAPSSSGQRRRGNTPEELSDLAEQQIDDFLGGRKKPSLALERYLNDPEEPIPVLQSQLDQLPLYFFGSSRNENRRISTSIIRSLIFQLGTQRPDLANIVEEVYKTSTSRIADNFDELWGLFKRMIQAAKPIVCVIDGLAECQERDDGLVQLTHHTTKEYLLSRPKRLVEICRPADTMLFHSCLSYLNLAAFETPLARRQKRVTTKGISAVRASHVLQAYAASNLFHHLLLREKVPYKAIRQFFESAQAATWTEAPLVLQGGLLQLASTIKPESTLMGFRAIFFGGGEDAAFISRWPKNDDDDEDKDDHHAGGGRYSMNNNYYRPLSLVVDTHTHNYFEEDKGSILDENILDHSTLDSRLEMSPPMNGSRRGPFAVSSAALFSPKADEWQHVDMQPMASNNPFVEQPNNNPFIRANSQSSTYGHQSHGWNMGNGLGMSTLMQVHDGLPSEFEVNAPVFQKLQRDWSVSDAIDHRAMPKRMRPHSPTLRSHPEMSRRGDGIRKKNARFDILAKQNFTNIDQLISQSTDKGEIKELKQQKRLLRNRQAVLDSRQRKKQHTERLEDEKKYYTALINYLEEDLADMKLAQDVWLRMEQQYKQFISTERRSCLDLEDMTLSNLSSLYRIQPTQGIGIINYRCGDPHMPASCDIFQLQQQTLVKDKINALISRLAEELFGQTYHTPDATEEPMPIDVDSPITATAGAAHPAWEAVFSSYDTSPDSKEKDPQDKGKTGGVRQHGA